MRLHRLDLLPELKAKLATEQAELFDDGVQQRRPAISYRPGGSGIVAFDGNRAHSGSSWLSARSAPHVLFDGSRWIASEGVLQSSSAIRTPHISTIITGVFVAAFAAVASIDEDGRSH